MECYSRARSISEALDDSSGIFPALRGLWVYHFIKADLSKAKEVAFQLLDLAERTLKNEAQTSIEDPEGLLIEAQRALGMTCLYLGEYNAACDHIEQAIALYDRQRHASHMERFGVDPWVVSASYRAHILWFLGQSEQALKQSAEVLSVARELDNPFILTGALAFAAYLQQHLRNAAATKELASEAIILAEKYGFPFWVQQQKILKGWAMVELGEIDDGVAMLERGLATYQEMGARLALPWFLSLSAETLARIWVAMVMQFALCGPQRPWRKPPANIFTWPKFKGLRVNWYCCRKHLMRQPGQKCAFAVPSKPQANEMPWP